MSQVNTKTNVYIEKKKTLFGTKKYYRNWLPGLEDMLTPKHDEDILVKLRNVDITYGSGSKAFKAVSDFSVNIYKGEVLGLVGESGSGKSTIGKTLVGLVPYSFGEIKLLERTLPKKLKRGFKFGKKLREYKEIENFMVNKVQMIFQDPANSLNPHVNVEAVVSEGLENTKNAREIYLYNNDQEVEKELYEKHLNQKDDVKFFGTYAKELSAKIAENEDVAYQALYVDLLSELEKSNNKSAYEFLLAEKTKRDELNKLSEKECKRILVVEMLKSVGLDKTVLRRYPLEFSGGQQQRIGISRSVVLRPQLLVADEPISALDVSIQAQVVNIFNDLKEKYNLTILFIAHDLRMVEYISDRIAVMNKGRLLEIGKTEEIMKHSLHPYTKSLLDAVPSIYGTKGSLIGYVYDPQIHQYNDEVQPVWNKINDDHYVLGTPQEIENWKKEFWK
ncbi:ABC transporter ATP-binding protein [Mycoplasmopsis glycophila]|uniref:Phosphate ABC transporter ATP-binding protein n=1 Tax=Mycoplasmopsis glycophila TaxID=171285 RepID=A0A449AWM8_9BACT|nr:ABC transporter ATP-binding protein [Mycoplasmopsis glycophila]VEU71092.1 phosphate ABC transporter ATP-binding protein [Mycoplasmopsis glycophila]